MVICSASLNGIIHLHLQQKVNCAPDIQLQKHGLCCRPVVYYLLWLSAGTLDEPDLFGCKVQ